MRYTREHILKTIDLAVLHPTATRCEIREAGLIVEATGMASICVASCNVACAKTFTDRVCSVIGFPHGTTTPRMKRIEAFLAMDAGAMELDIVTPYGRFLDGCKASMPYELKGIVELAHARGVKVKAILESCYYSDAQLEAACKMCVACGVDWVKTSTGFAHKGATPDAVAIMAAAVEGKAQVKASGGIRTYDDACRYLDLGCTRLGVGAANYQGVLP